MRMPGRRGWSEVRRRLAALGIVCLLTAGCTAEGGEPVTAPAQSDPPTPTPARSSDALASPSPQGIFADVDGRIVYGDLRLRSGGIFAVDPTRPNDPKNRILVSERSGEPLGWSSDGSRLLIRREVYDANRDPVADLDLFVLNPDGTETRLTKDRDWTTGSISPDGSQVVYAAGFDGHLYTVDTQGGEPRLLLASARLLYSPTFSPDGTQIAYFDGGGDNSHSLRVMNADGSGVRVLFDQAPAEVGHVYNLIWSPDGSRLAFSAQEGGIWIVGVDGSGLTKVIPDGVNVYWSPDGSRISYQSADALSGALGALEIATVDGTHAQQFGYGGSGPWNPLPLPVSR
jgi:Tol biopolymer transport system component